MLLTLLSFLIIATLTISMISELSAADITIDPKTSGGLKKAMETAKNGDTILLKNGVYTGKNNVNLIINKNINIEGLGSKVVLDGEGNNHIFTITGETVSLKKLKVTNGYSTASGGAINNVKGNLIVKDCTFTNNLAITGGAICTYNKLTVDNCTFTNNKAANYGGAIDSFGKVNINNCTFKNNQATKDGGGAIVSGGNPGDSLTVKKSTFINNRAEDGGAIDTYIKATISSCTFTNNRAMKKDAGAIDFRYGHSTVNSCTFKNNQAKRNGGAICIGVHSGYTTKVEIVNSKFTNNIAGKIYNAIYTYRGSKFTQKNVSITPKFGTKVKI